jgi:hypothetical protein
MRHLGLFWAEWHTNPALPPSTWDTYGPVPEAERVDVLALSRRLWQLEVEAKGYEYANQYGGLRTTSDSAAEYLRARTRAATVTDPHVLDLRAEIADLLADNRELRRRLDAMKAERDRAQRANRRRDWQGAVVALWDTLRGRTR